MTDLTPEALDRLETLAGKATPGPWTFHLDALVANALPVWRMGSTSAGEDVCALGREWPESKANAEYIAAASAATVLALIAEVRQLRQCLAAVEHEQAVEAKHAALAEGEACDVCSHLEIEQMAQHDIELMEENDALLAKIKRVREAADRIDERSAGVILRALAGGAS